ISELPFLGHVIGSDSFRADNEEQPFALVDGVANFLMERERARRHGDAVEPNIEQRQSVFIERVFQSVVKPPDKRLVIAARVVEASVRADIDMEILSFPDKKYDPRAMTPSVANLEVHVRSCLCQICDHDGSRFDTLFDA